MRLCMKSYSFIRENAYKVIHPWNKDDKSGILMNLGYGLQLKSCEPSSWQSPCSCPSVTLHQLVQPVEVSRLLRNTTQLMSCTGNYHTYLLRDCYYAIHWWLQLPCCYTWDYAPTSCYYAPTSCQHPCCYAPISLLLSTVLLLWSKICLPFP